MLIQVSSCKSKIDVSFSGSGGIFGDIASTLFLSQDEPKDINKVEEIELQIGQSIELYSLKATDASGYDNVPVKWSLVKDIGSLTVSSAGTKAVFNATNIQEGHIQIEYEGIKKIINVSVTSIPIKNLALPTAVSIAEDISAGNYDFSISLNEPSEQAASVDYTITRITTEVSDHSIASGTLNFNIGEQSKTLSLSIANDYIDEFDESFKVTLSNPKGINLTQAETVFTIIDEDPLPNLTINDYDAQPGERAKLQITLDRESEKDIQLQYNTIQSGNAVAGTDFQARVGQIINIANNSLTHDFTSKTYYVDINAPTKSYSIELSNPVHAIISNNTSEIDITVPITGTLDKAFSDDGKQTTNTSGPYDRAKAVVPLRNGYVYTLNHSQAQGSIHRYDDEGVLDPTFNGSGIKNINVFSGYDSIVDGVAYNDMSLVAISSSRSVEDSFDILKLNPDGSLDTSFSSDGIREIDLGPYARGKAISMDIDRSGKILIAGYIANTDRDIYVTRLNTDGSTDTSFGSSGVLILDMLGTNTDDTVHDVKANSNGTIYIGGINLTGTQGPSFVARLNENGTLDTSFDSDGIYESILAVDYTSRDMKSSINPLANGDIILTVPNRQSTRAYPCQIEKILSSGSIDTSFGSAGYFTTLPGPNIRGCRKTLEDKNGNIVVYSDVASGGYPDAVFVLSANGVQDMTFNGVGYASGMTQTAQGVQFFRDFTLDADGKLIFIGGFNDISITKMWYSDDNIPDVTVTDSLIDEDATEHFLSYELSHRVEFPFQLNYSTADMTATAGVDYNPSTSVIIENLGRAGAKIPITVNSDGLVEIDETIEVNISTSDSSVNITDSIGVMTIANDD